MHVSFIDGRLIHVFVCLLWLCRPAVQDFPRPYLRLVPLGVVDFVMWLRAKISIRLRPMFFIVFIHFQVPGLVPFVSKFVVFCNIYASGAPMWYFTDTTSILGGSLASPSGRTHFRKHTSETENKINLVANAILCILISYTFEF